MQRAYREKENILIVGAVYELATGRVRWLDRIEAPGAEGR